MAERSRVRRSCAAVLGPPRVVARWRSPWRPPLRHRRAGAGRAITTFSAGPSTTQAGGHPDLEVDFNVGTRVDPLIPNSCNCNQIKDVTGRTPGRLHRQPARGAAVHAAQFSARPMPGRLPGRCREPVRSSSDDRAPTLPRHPTPLYNLDPGAGAGRPARLQGAPIFNFPIYTVSAPAPAATTGSTPKSKGSPQIFALAGFNQKMWGVPAVAGQRRRTLATRAGVAPDTWVGTSEQPRKAVPLEPDQLRRAAQTSTFTTTAYDHGVHEGTAPGRRRPAATSSASTPRSRPSRRPTAADSASGLDVDLKVPQNESPATPSDSEIKGDHGDLARGLLDQPRAPPTARPPARTPRRASAPRKKPSAPSTQGRHPLDRARPCRTPIPGAIYLGEPQPGNRYRIFITADGFGTHVKLPGSAYPDPETGQLDGQLRKPARRRR